MNKNEDDLYQLEFEEIEQCDDFDEMQEIAYDHLHSKYYLRTKVESMRKVLNDILWVTMIHNMNNFHIEMIIEILNKWYETYEEEK